MIYLWLSLKILFTVLLVEWFCLQCFYHDCRFLVFLSWFCDLNVLNTFSLNCKTTRLVRFNFCLLKCSVDLKLDNIHSNYIKKITKNNSSGTNYGWRIESGPVMWKKECYLLPLTCSCLSCYLFLKLLLTCGLIFYFILFS